MLRLFRDKLKESLISVVPVALIVIILNFTPLISLTGKEIAIFSISAALLIFGMAFFNLGADVAMTPMGDHIGAGLTKSKKVALLIGVCFVMGVFITIAEPDLTVLASQVKEKINPTLLTVTVGVGVGLFLVISVIRIIKGTPLSHILIFFYMCLFAFGSLLVIGNDDFLPLAFDSGGVTTGPITVPFIMALGVGIASTIGGKKSGENSFGLVALCSIGPMLAVMILGIFSSGNMDYHLSESEYAIADNFFASLAATLGSVAKEVAIALGLIVVFFLLLDLIFLKLPVKKLRNIGAGVIYTFIGLLIFLTSAQIGFLPIGYKLGCELASTHPYALIAVGFVLGAVVVLAEPAVHVLTKQVDNVTSGGISKLSMLIALCLGVGISIGLSMLRIVKGFNILYYLVPGYLLSIGLSFFVPGIYTAIAFDSGGVASGPLTSSFILPLAIGACYTLSGSGKILTDAFGIVAMVAMTPLITIQILGFKAVVMRGVHKRIAMKRILSLDDEYIINFEIK